MKNINQDRIYLLFDWIASIGATSAWLAMALITFIDVVGREVLSAPIPGGYEIIQVLMSVGVFFSLPLVALRKGHVTVDLFKKIFPTGLNRLIDSIAKITSVVFFGFLAYSLCMLTLFAYSTGVRTSYLSIPHWAVGALMTAFLFLTTACCFVARDADQANTNDGGN